MSERKPKYWLHRISYEERLSYVLLDKGILSIGFSDFGHEKYIDKIKTDLVETLEDAWGGYGRNRFYLYRFVVEMHAGDYVVVPKPGKLFDIYQLKGQVFSTERLNIKNLTDIDGFTVSKDDNGYLVANGEIIDLGFFWEVEPVLKNQSRDADGIDVQFVSKFRYLGTNLELTGKSQEYVSNIIKNKDEHKEENNRIKWTNLRLEDKSKHIYEVVREITYKNMLSDLVDLFFKMLGGRNIKKPLENQESTKYGFPNVMTSFKKVNSRAVAFVQDIEQDSDTDKWVEERIRNYREVQGNDPENVILWLFSVDDEFSSQTKRLAGKDVILVTKKSFAEKMAALDYDTLMGEDSQLDVLNNIYENAINETNRTVEETISDIINNDKIVVSPIKFEYQNFNFIKNKILKEGKDNGKQYGLITDGNKYYIFNIKNGGEYFETVQYAEIENIINGNTTINEKKDNHTKKRIKALLGIRKSKSKDSELDEKLNYNNGRYEFSSEKTESEFWSSLLKNSNSTRYLFRYTGIERLMDVIRDNTFGMSGIAGMNDISELDYFDKYLGVESDNNPNQYFISSCSSEMDDLTLWRLYGEARGVCMVFSEKRRKSPKFIVHNIHYAERRGYDSKLEKVKELMEYGVVFKQIDIWKHFFKPYDYQVEKEIRVLYKGSQTEGDIWIKTNTNSIINPIKNFKISESTFPLVLEGIILGPKFPEKNTNKVQIKTLLQNNNQENIWVMDSKIQHYR